MQSQLEAAGYDVQRIEFPFDFFEQVGDATLEQTAPNPTTYVDQTDFDVMEYSGSGSVSGLVTGVDLALVDPATSTSGCEASDFDGFPAGDVALVQRGACNFSDKVANAEAAGAVAVITSTRATPPTGRACSSAPSVGLARPSRHSVRRSPSARPWPEVM